MFNENEPVTKKDLAELSANLSSELSSKLSSELSAELSSDFTELSTKLSSDFTELSAKLSADFTELSTELSAKLSADFTELSAKLSADFSSGFTAKFTSMEKRLLLEMGHAVNVVLEQFGSKVAVIDDKYEGPVRQLRADLDAHCANSALHTRQAPLAPKRTSRRKP